MVRERKAEKQNERGTIADLIDSFKVKNIILHSPKIKIKSNDNIHGSNFVIG